MQRKENKQIYDHVAYCVCGLDKKSVSPWLTRDVSLSFGGRKNVASSSFSQSLSQGRKEELRNCEQPFLMHKASGGFKDALHYHLLTSYSSLKTIRLQQPQGSKSCQRVTLTPHKWWFRAAFSSIVNQFRGTSGVLWISLTSGLVSIQKAHFYCPALVWDTDRA